MTKPTRSRVAARPEDVAGSQTSASENDDPAPENVDQMRTKRLQDLFQEAMRMESPLKANLGAVEADLFEMAMNLKKCMAKALPNQPETWDELVQILQGCDRVLKVTKQIDRFAQLGIKLQEMESRTEEAQAKTSQEKQQRKTEKLPK